MRVGVLGLGSIGARHVRNLRGMGHTVLPFDPDANKEGVLSRDSVIAHADALVIASPTGQHYQDLLDCMATGKPVFVEKPIAATEQEWRELKHHDGIKQVFVGNNLRFRSCIRAAARWLSDYSLIGRPIWASFILGQRNTRPEYLRDGVTLNWGAHECDLALILLGPAEVKTAWISPSDHIADIAIEHSLTGCRTSIHLDYVTEEEIRRFVIVGNLGRIEVDILRNRAALDYRRASCGDPSFDKDYIAEMKAFIKRIEGKETLGATGDDGLAALKICLDAKRMAGL